MSTSPSTKFTAVRVWNKPRTKATVVLFEDGVEIDRAGGNRAARAQAVIVSLQNPESFNRHVRESNGIYGLRADYLKAVTEAAKLTKGGPRTQRSNSRYGRPGSVIEFTPVPTLAIPVTEQEEN